MSDSWFGSTRLTVWAWVASLAVCVSFAPLVDTNGFLWAGAVAGASVALMGAVGRRLRLPVPLLVVLQLVVLLEWATVTYAAAEAWGGLLPTRESLAVLVDLVQSALLTAQEYAPPAPADEGIEGSLALVVGAVALVVDLLAISWHRPALVGLVFLGVYMTPVSLLAGEVPLAAFVPGALAFVFLLGAVQRDRVSHWGRQLGGPGILLGLRDRQVTVSSLVRSGRKVGLGAVALAVVVPAVVPTLPRTFLADGPLSGDQEGSGIGGGDSVEIDNPMLDLRRNLGDRSEQVLLTLTTDDGPPEYLRLAALDTFTGTSWQPSLRDPDNATSLAKISSPPGLTSLVDRDQVAAEVTISESFHTSWLPTIYPVTNASIEGDNDSIWSVDSSELDISVPEGGGDGEGAGLRYRFTSTLVLPTEEELALTPAPTEEMSHYLELPASEEFPAVIAEAAAGVTAGANSRFAQAQALQDWFRQDGGFRYSVAPGQGDGLATIERFLTEERVGYCEQFAASMALMARTLGIPSRVAVGFLQPERLDDGTWAFRGVDMHSWPELYFESVGWVRFEPTPGVRTGAAPRFTGLPESQSGQTTLPSQNSVPLPGQASTTPAPADRASGGQGSAGGMGTGGLVAAGAVLLLLVLAVTPRGTRWALRSRRWRRAGPSGTPVPEVAWQELCATAVDLGVHVDPDATVRAVGRGLRPLVNDTPGAVAALNRLVTDVERSRFARRAGAAARPLAESQEDLDLVCGRIADGRSPGQRWRAVWLPASLLLRLTARSQRIRRGLRARPEPARQGGTLLRAEEQPGG